MLNQLIQRTLIMDKNVDSVIIFSNKMGYTMNKQILGKERMPTDNFL
jgi:CRISPR-associated protein Cas2